MWMVLVVLVFCTSDFFQMATPSGRVTSRAMCAKSAHSLMYINNINVGDYWSWMPLLTSRCLRSWPLWPDRGHLAC